LEWRASWEPRRGSITLGCACTQECPGLGCETKSEHGKVHCNIVSMEPRERTKRIGVVGFDFSFSVLSFSVLKPHAALLYVVGVFVGNFQSRTVSLVRHQRATKTKHSGKVLQVRRLGEKSMNPRMCCCLWLCVVVEFHSFQSKKHLRSSKPSQRGQAKLAIITVQYYIPWTSNQTRQRIETNPEGNLCTDLL
jgi:hypothetical protein